MSGQKMCSATCFAVIAFTGRVKPTLAHSLHTTAQGGGGEMQHVYTLHYPNRDRDGSYGSNRGTSSTVADVQAPRSWGYSAAVQGILVLLLKDSRTRFARRPPVTT
jgi:hypothetical protein